MSASWPAGLPAYPLIDGSTESLPDITIRTKTDTGPAKVRRRYTAGVSTFTMQFVFDSTDMSSFSTFYNSTTTGGSVEFSINHPRTGSSVNARFASVPQIQPLGNGYSRVTFLMEVLP